MSGSIKIMQYSPQNPKRMKVLLKEFDGELTFYTKCFCSILNAFDLGLPVDKQTCFLYDQPPTHSWPVVS